MFRVCAVATAAILAVFTLPRPLALSDTFTLRRHYPVPPVILAPARPDLVPSCQFPKGLCGYKSRDGETIIDGLYDWTDAFQHGLAAVAKDGKFGFIDPGGALVIEPRFSIVTRFRHGFAAATAKDRRIYGVIDETGRWLLPPKFCWALPVSKDYIWTTDCRPEFDVGPITRVRSNGGMGGGEFVGGRGKITVRDRTGDPIATIEDVKAIWPFDSEKVAVRFSVSELLSTVGVLNANGSVQVKPIYSHIQSLSEGLAVARKRTTLDSLGGFYGRRIYMDENGTEVIKIDDFKSNGGRITDFSNGKALVLDRLALGNWSISAIDKTGRRVAGPRNWLAGTYDFSAPYWLKTKSGFEDGNWQLRSSKGLPVGNARFSTVCDFDGHGRACVSDGNMHGIISNDGSFSVTYSDQKILPFDRNNGTYWREKSGRWGIIDGEGKWLLPPRLEHPPKYRMWRKDFLSALVLDNRSAPKPGPTQFSATVSRDGKFGVVDGLGNWLIEPVFDELRGPYSRGLMPARFGDKWGYIDYRGKIAIPPSFDDAACFTSERARVIRDGKLEIIARSGRVLHSEPAPIYGLAIPPGYMSQAVIPDLACESKPPNL